MAGGMSSSAAAGIVEDHMAPCVFQCSACRAAGHSHGMCMACAVGLHRLFAKNADDVDVVLLHYYSGACHWDKATFDDAMQGLSYEPSGIVITVASGSTIHSICARTGVQKWFMRG